MLGTFKSRPVWSRFPFLQCDFRPCSQCVVIFATVDSERSLRRFFLPLSKPIHSIAYRCGGNGSRYFGWVQCEEPRYKTEAYENTCDKSCISILVFSRTNVSVEFLIPIPTIFSERAESLHSSSVLSFVEIINNIELGLKHFQTPFVLLSQESNYTYRPPSPKTNKI